MNHRRRILLWLGLALLLVGSVSLNPLSLNANRLAGQPPAIAPAVQSLPQELVPLTDIAQVVAGGGNTCALTTTGGAKCWGRNDYGQLGDSTTDNKSVPVDVVGLSSGVAAISLNGVHTCAVTTAGGIKCWGGNWSGALGDGTTTHRSSPVDVVGLGNSMAAIAVGDAHTCALTTTGGVKCWGHNDHRGQLGIGIVGDIDSFWSVPMDVVGLGSGVVAIAAGTSHTCALTTSGGVKCWGDNWYGQLGDGTDTHRPTSVDVVGLDSGVTAIAAGWAHTCILTTAGGVKCWGNNASGQLGDGTTVAKTTPVDVVGLGSGIAAIDVGGSHTCALTTAGGVKCWGRNSEGQLGDSTTASKLTPVDELAPSPPPLTLRRESGASDWWTGLYGQFDQMGSYQIVIYALDKEGDGLLSRPWEMTVTTGWRVFLPALQR